VQGIVAPVHSNLRRNFIKQQQESRLLLELERRMKNMIPSIIIRHPEVTRERASD
jgi:hypothetical protein